MIGKLFYNLKIKILLVFRPVIFFDQINQLDWYKKTLQTWVKNNVFISGSRILEVGSATGELTAFISNANYLATGVDLSKAMISTAQKKNPDIPYYVADVNSLPFENESFDAVISASVVNIVPDKDKALKEMIRICKNGGVISILTPLEGFTDSALDSLKISLEATNFSSAVLTSWHKFAPKMSLTETENLLINMGLNIQKSEKYLNGLVFSITAIKPS